jgi:MOSC domain-containing protein YiiM
MQETGRTGWYFRVLREGHIQAGKKLLLVERPCPRWTVAAANQVMHHELADAHATRELANCVYLAARWRTKLERRVTTGVIEDWSARLEGPSREKTG